MKTNHSDLKKLLDRAAIQDVLSRYFHGVDIGDKDMVRSCFANDVEAQYDKRPSVSGIEELMNQIPSFAKQASGEWKICTHFMGNFQVKHLAADIAETEMNAFAFLVLAQKETDQVSMRSLRYLDRLVCIDGKWKIFVRVHTLDWSCELPSSFALTMSQRLGAIPDGFPLVPARAAQSIAFPLINC